MSSVLLVAPVSLEQNGSHTPSIHSSSTGVQQADPEPEKQKERHVRQGGEEKKEISATGQKEKKILKLLQNNFCTSF